MSACHTNVIYLVVYVHIKIQAQHVHVISKTKSSPLFLPFSPPSPPPTLHEVSSITFNPVNYANDDLIIIVYVTYMGIVHRKWKLLMIVINRIPCLERGSIGVKRGWQEHKVWDSRYNLLTRSAHSTLTSLFMLLSLIEGVVNRIVIHLSLYLSLCHYIILFPLSTFLLFIYSFCEAIMLLCA